MTRPTDARPGPSAPAQPQPGGEDALVPWPDPTPAMLADPTFEAIWQAIKSWDVNVPDQYTGYCGTTGNHARRILDAIAAVRAHQPDVRAQALEEAAVLCSNAASGWDDGTEGCRATMALEGAADAIRALIAAPNAGATP